MMKYLKAFLEKLSIQGNGKIEMRLFSIEFLISKLFKKKIVWIEIGRKWKKEMPLLTFLLTCNKRIFYTHLMLILKFKLCFHHCNLRCLKKIRFIALIWHGP